MSSIGDVGRQFEPIQEDHVSTEFDVEAPSADETPVPKPGKPTVNEIEADGDMHTFAIRFMAADGSSDGCMIVISDTAASIWNVSASDAAGSLAEVIDTAVPRPLPTAFRFASDTVPPSLP